MARTKQTGLSLSLTFAPHFPIARKSTGGKAPRRCLPILPQALNNTQTGNVKKNLTKKFFTFFFKSVQINQVPPFILNRPGNNNLRSISFDMTRARDPNILYSDKLSPVERRKICRFVFSLDVAWRY